jgi:hypothetical protein
MLDDTQWAVEFLEPHLGRVALVSPSGQRQRVSYRFLVNHPRCQTAGPGALGANRGRQAMSVRDLKPEKVGLAKLRFAHLMEVQCGCRGGDPLQPGLGEPKPEYDPDRTTITERRRAKAAELAAMDPDAARLVGLDRVGVRTLERWERKRRRFGLIGCADDRWLRESGGHPSVNDEVREAILVVRAETLHRSRVGGRARETMIHRYVRETFPDRQIDVPSYDTLLRVWYEWFGPGGARQRYERSAELPVSGGHVLVIRPGQVVALDTTILPVMVREGVFGEPVMVHLTLALDVYTHSVCAFRLTLVSDTSVDVAMVLRDVMLPLPMRAEWGEDMEWPYPGLPAAVIAEFVGHKVAALPFFRPETVTTDHGSVYRNHHLVEVQERIGCRILPARVLRPTDKQAVERAFGIIRSLLFEQLPGYTGVDVADRGADPAGDAVLTVTQMERLIATWVVRVWQNRLLGDYAPSWDPGGGHSPNTLFAASFAQSGFAMEIPSPELYYQFLIEHRVRRIDRRGVKIKGLWYDGEALEQYRGSSSTRGGKHKSTWIVHREPRDRRLVFFQDPLSQAWHPLRWTGLPPEGEVPAFGDSRVEDLLTRVREAGLKPRSDAELLPILLELIGGYDPVHGWHSQLTGAQRTQHAREATRSAAAIADRPAAAPAVGGPGAQGATVIPWPMQRGQVTDAVDAELRRRREQIVAVPPGLPRPLGASYHTRNLLFLPDDDGEPTAAGCGLSPESGD